MSERQPVLYNSPVVAEVGGVLLASIVGGTAGVIGAAATESYTHPKESAVRSDLDVRIGVQQYRGQAIETELSRRELGYKPRTTDSFAELQDAQQRATATIAHLRAEKAPLDSIHHDILTNGALAGILVTVLAVQAARGHTKRRISPMLYESSSH